MSTLRPLVNENVRGRPRNARVPISRRRAVLFRIAACVASLLMLEAFLRVTHLPRAKCEFASVDFAAGTFAFDERRFWRLQQDVVGSEANVQGMRGYWPEAEKLANEYRIVCVGDSCTFGSGVTYPETYGMQLAAELGRMLPGKNVRCVLLALPGYSTYQSRILMQQFAAGLRPDLVVLYTGAWNDYLPAMRYTDADWGRRLVGEQSGIRVAQIVGSVVEAVWPGDDPADLMQAFEAGALPALRRVPIEAYGDNLAAMIEMAHDQQAELAVVMPPLPNRTHDLFPIANAYREATRQIATSAGVPLCDVEPELRRLESALPERLRAASKYASTMFCDWVHPSAYGHRVLARALTRTLVLNGALPDGVGSRTAMPADTATHLEVTADGDAIDIVVSPVPLATGYVLYYVDQLTGAIGCVEIGPDARIHIPIGREARFLSCAHAYAPRWVGELSNLSDVVVHAKGGPMTGKQPAEQPR